MRNAVAKELRRLCIQNRLGRRSYRAAKRAWTDTPRRERARLWRRWHARAKAEA